MAIWNLISQGVTDFYLIHHDEYSESVKDFVAQFDGRATIRFANKSTPAFMQGRMFTIMGEIARRDGFDVFIPFDSDEFIHPVEASGSLLQQLEDHLNDADTPGLEIKNIDHVQAHEVFEFALNSLLSAKYVAVSARGKLDGFGAETDPLGTFLARDSTKVVVNLRALPEFGRFWFVEGFHQLFIDGDRAKLSTRHQLEIAHLIYRSRDTFVARRLHGARRDAGGFGKDTSPRNLIMWAAQEEKMAQLWAEVSWVNFGDHAGLADGNVQVELRHSASLQRVHAAVSPLLLAAKPGPDVWDEAGNWKFRQQILDLAVDSSIGFPEIQRLITQNSRLSSERDHLAALLRRHAPSVQFELKTRSPLANRLKRGAKKVLRNLGVNLRNR